MKRFLAWLLVALPVLSQAQFTFTTNADNTITITGYTGSGGEVIIPDTIYGLPVTTIGASAFQPLKSLTSVIIGTNVISIGNYAFEGCSSLTNVSISSSVTSIGNSAFGFTSMKSVSIPKSVTSVAYPFYNCASLTTITVDTNNPAYISVDGVLFNRIQNALIEYPGGKTGGYIIPNGVTSIVDYAFAYCPSLSSVTIPGSVISIGNYVFYSCTSLMTIIVDASNTFYFSDVDNVLFDKIQTTLIQYPAGKNGTSYTIPIGVTNIAAAAFEGSSNLINVTIPSSVTTIGTYAFVQCSKLKSITIPDNVTKIPGEAFEQCRSLTNIIIGNSVTSIGGFAFYYCTSLKSITIPKGVSSIQSWAFNNCSVLSTIYFMGDAPGNGSDTSIFQGTSYNAMVYYMLGTTGWASSFGGLPTKLWNPAVQINSATFGVRANRFGFTITGTSGLVILVEASTNLSNPDWQPVQTNTLITGTAYFSDPQWTNYPNRFYRLRSP
jgi:hypothetical protein